MIVDHMGFITPSVEGSVRFWTEVMGFEARPVVERTGEWIAPFTGIAGATMRIAHLFGYGEHIEFIEFMSPDGPSTPIPINRAGAGHLCLKVSDLDALYQRIIAAGGGLAGTPTTITEGPATGIRGLYVRDPQGIVIEVLEAPNA